MIRKYRQQDADRLIAIWRSASDLAHPFLSKSFQDEAQKLIREVYLPQAETMILEQNGTIQGFIALIGNTIGGLFVDPDAIGKGYGRALVDWAYAEKGPLEVEVFRDNPIGRRFYDRYGFVFKEEAIDEPSGFPIMRMTYRG
ncbi:GNAT family N-acetyltransferase [Nitratireductor sp. CH_MIT9313-5]|uniref:GNAT family N-acetyltransferase n=1 Tax=Nitratireductor sp. CH_MIT9313-5 TaxID=3107764 RepID=UPI003009EA50